VRNAVAALAMVAEAGADMEAARAHLAAFQGVKRRLELRGTAAGVSVYDDFAHDPTAVKETLRTMRASSTGGRLVAVFEPRSYTSRTRVFQEDFAQAFAEADLVIVASAHLPGKVPEDQRISEKDLVGGIRAQGTDARFVAGVPEIVETLGRELRDKDVVLILSNGGFGGIHDRLLQQLATRNP